MVKTSLKSVVTGRKPILTVVCTARPLKMGEMKHYLHGPVPEVAKLLMYWCNITNPSCGLPLPPKSKAFIHKGSLCSAMSDI